MSVSLHDMEIMATSLPEINTSNGYEDIIEVNDLGDDMGMSLLANSKYTTASSSSSSSGNTFSVDTHGSGSGIQDIGVSNLEPLETIDINFDTPSNKPSYSNTSSAPVSFTRESTYQPANTISNSSYGNMQSSSGPSINLSPATMRDPVKEAEEKSNLINKLQRLEAKGFPVAKRFTMDNSLDEVKAEYNRLVDARQLETSIKFQRNMLMGFVTGLEWMNNRFDPFDLKLDGWSEGVHENIEDYDEIFEELYDKYKEKGKMPPEARLVFQLAGSGFMCHVSNSFFRAKMPSAEDIFKKNPELAKQFAAAAAQQAAPGFGNFMGMAMGVPQGQGQQQGPVGVPPGMASGPAQTGAFFNSPQMPQHVAAAPPVQTARREMKGPSFEGVDDILKTFQEVKMAEESGPSFPNQMPTMNQYPSMVAASEIGSIVSDDNQSYATERTGTSRSRAKRRAVPSGNVVSLNV